MREKKGKKYQINIVARETKSCVQDVDNDIFFPVGKPCDPLFTAVISATVWKDLRPQIFIKKKKH